MVEHGLNIEVVFFERCEKPIVPFLGKAIAQIDESLAHHPERAGQCLRRGCKGFEQNDFDQVTMLRRIREADFPEHEVGHVPVKRLFFLGLLERMGDRLPLGVINVRAILAKRPLAKCAQAAAEFSNVTASVAVLSLEGSLVAENVIAD